MIVTQHLEVVHRLHPSHCLLYITLHGMAYDTPARAPGT